LRGLDLAGRHPTLRAETEGHLGIECVVPDPVPLGMGSFGEPATITQLLADDEERRLNIVSAENIQNQRCDFRVWPVIETQRDKAHGHS
jgi:hypothetical protein